MPPELRKFLLTMLCLCAVISVRAQVCTGSLGDPVIHQDFGSGTSTFGPQLPPGSTDNLTYIAGTCPKDGYYTIIHSLAGNDNCHQDTWHNVYSDHTGNPNGYMMVINASDDPTKSNEVFFTQQAQGLCTSTKYQFSVYVLNLLKKSVSGPGWQQPKIQFSIEDKNGNPLTPSMPKTFDPTDAPTWQFFEMYFTTTANVNDVVVKMTNLAPGGNGNDLIIDDINFRACGPVIQSGFGSFNGQFQPQSICQGTNSTFTLQAKVSGVPPPYQWQKLSNDGTWRDITGATGNTYVTPSFENYAVGAYQYRIGVSNGSDISSQQCRVYSQPLEVDVNPLPTVNSIAPQQLCEGTPLLIQASGAAAYSWSGPGLSPTTPSAGPLTISNISLAQRGTYTVTPYSDKGCQGTPLNVQVNINPKIQAVASAGAPVCAGESVQLHASGGLYYKWTPSTGLDHDDIADPVASPLVTTTYSVTISNDACSDNSQSATATIMQVPVANGGGKKVIFEGQSVKLNGTVKGDNITSIYWTPSAGLDDPTSATPMASPTDDITYTMHVVSSFCGTSTDEVPVRVYKKITVYNAFSPNNDGINDYWNIEALITYPDCSVLVFDRYGKKVYQSTGYAKPWDGTYNGKALPVGTYYYVIDLKNNTPKLSGWVGIIR